MPDFANKQLDAQFNLSFRKATNNFFNGSICPMQCLAYTYTKKLFAAV